MFGLTHMWILLVIFLFDHKDKKWLSKQTKHVNDKQRSNKTRSIVNVAMSAALLFDENCMI